MVRHLAASTGQRDFGEVQLTLLKAVWRLLPRPRGGGLSAPGAAYGCVSRAPRRGFAFFEWT